jgi:hypothetical protein
MALSLLVVGGIGGLGVGVTAWRIPAWGGSVIVVAAAINLAACWLAFIPIAAAMRWSKEMLPQAVMGATTIRLMLATLAGWITCAFGPWRADVLVIWLVVFYLALLMIETIWAVRLVNRKPETSRGEGMQ